MLVGIDLTDWRTRGRGYQRVLRSLVPALLDAGGESLRLRAVRGNEPFPDARLGVQEPLAPPLGRHLDLPRRARAEGWDAMLFPTTTCWWRGPCPEAVLIQDLAPLECPGAGLLRGNAGWKAALAYRAIRRARVLLAGSEATRDAIRRHWGREAVLAGNGFTPLPPAEPIETPETFFLLVGPLDRRRNHAAQVRAFLDADLPGDLVVTGARERGGWLLDPGEARALDHPRVRFPGHVTDGQMRTLYERASGLLYASLYEGFGFPILEARASGCPVLASERGASPETWDTGVLLCDPGNPRALREGILRLAANPRTAPEEDAICARYRWKDAATRILAALAPATGG